MGPQAIACGDIDAVKQGRGVSECFNGAAGNRLRRCLGVEDKLPLPGASMGPQAIACGDNKRTPGTTLGWCFNGAAGNRLRRFPVPGVGVAPVP